MLYTCFDEKTYDEWHDEGKCFEAYIAKQAEIRAVKRKVMEWLDNVEEGRIYVEEVLKNQVDTNETGETLDAENEKDNIECQE